jgi:hypothetical protein
LNLALVIDPDRIILSGRYCAPYSYGQQYGRPTAVISITRALTSRSGEWVRVAYRSILYHILPYPGERERGEARREVVLVCQTWLH